MTFLPFISSRKSSQIALALGGKCLPPRLQVCAPLHICPGSPSCRIFLPLPHMPDQQLPRGWACGLVIAISSITQPRTCTPEDCLLYERMNRRTDQWNPQISQETACSDSAGSLSFQDQPEAETGALAPLRSCPYSAAYWLPDFEQFHPVLQFTSVSFSLPRTTSLHGGNKPS